MKKIIVTFYASGRRRRETGDSQAFVDIDVVIQSESVLTSEATSAFNDAVVSDIQTTQVDTLADGVTVTSSATTTQATADTTEGLIVLLPDTGLLIIF